MNTEPRYWALIGMDDANIKDLLTSLEKDEISAIVDEESGGIIGYVLNNFVCEIIEKLNNEKVTDKH